MPEASRYPPGRGSTYDANNNMEEPEDLGILLAEVVTGMVQK